MEPDTFTLSLSFTLTAVGPETAVNENVSESVNVTNLL